MISRFLTVLLASCVALPAISALAQDQTLSTEEQAALAELNGETAAQIAAIAAEIDNWQTTYDVLRGRIGQISAATDANATVDAETAGAARVVRPSCPVASARRNRQRVCGSGKSNQAEDERVRTGGSQTEIRRGSGGGQERGSMARKPRTRFVPE